ncbi:dynamin GTPase [Pelomyxa schiedti]|nr:dynamin GTPase [Pelomyxa schiedti]
MEELLPVINKLQDVFATVGGNVDMSIDLPQIVVVGSQSAGKSSVLENVVGRDFLPRGSGIVTRRPLVLRLRNVSKGTKPYSTSGIPTMAQSRTASTNTSTASATRPGAINPAQSQMQAQMQAQLGSAAPATAARQPMSLQQRTGNQPNTLQQPNMGQTSRTPTQPQAPTTKAPTSTPTITATLPAPSYQNDAEEWGEFLHRPGVLFTNFNDIRDEIVAETDRMTGKNKGISPDPITLTISSPHVVNLTLVDLPGITRVPVGDQPTDIERQVKDMVNGYISKPNSIILAVTAANVDSATSDALQMARMVDPQGVRTLGVITKLDLMDKGTDAMDIFTGRSIPLSLGYIGIINRSQEDINSGKPIRQALEDEKKFFISHPIYKSIAKRLGTQHLSFTLNKILLNHIRDTIPELKVKVNKLLADAKAEYSQYGDLISCNGGEGALLLQILTKFSNDFCAIIDGKSIGTQQISLTELTGGARISYIFNEIYSYCLSNMDPIRDLSPQDLRTVIKNATGPRASLFIPESSFELLVKQQVSKLEPPSIECSDLVYEELLRIVTQLEAKDLSRFPVLRQAVVEVVNALLSLNKSPAQTMISDLIKIELAYLNTSHPDFKVSQSLQAVFEMSKKEETAPNSTVNSAIASVKSGATQASQTVQNFAQSHRPGAPTTSGPEPPQPVAAKPPKTSASVPPPPPPVKPSFTQCPICNEQLSCEPSIVHAHVDSCMKRNRSLLEKFFGHKGQEQYDMAQAMLNDSKQQLQQQQQQQLQQQMLQQHEQRQLLLQQQQQLMQQQQAASRGPRASTPPPQQVIAPQEVHAEVIAHQDGATFSMPNSLFPGEVSDKDKFEAEVIKHLLKAYFDIVRKNVLDTVPKAIMHFLVNATKESLQNELVKALYKPEKFSELLAESPQVAQKRHLCKAKLDTLSKASEIISEVRDFSFSSH